MNNVIRIPHVGLGFLNGIIFVTMLFIWGPSISLAQESRDYAEWRSDPAGWKINPQHWKARVDPELRFSLKDKEWIVPIKFKNISKARQQIIRSNGALMYRVMGNAIASDGTRGEAIRIQKRHGFYMNAKYAHAEPGQTIFTECDIRYWMLVDKPGTYRVILDRLLSMSDALENTGGKPIEKTMPVGEIKIHVTP